MQRFQVEAIYADWIHQFGSKPAFYHFKGDHDRTYCAGLYRSPSYCIQHIGAYDHDTETIISPFSLAQVGVDDHPSPIIVMLNSGKLLAIMPCGTGHQDDLKCRRTTNAEDISAWDVAKTITTNNTQLPCAWVNTSGRVYVIFGGHIGTDNMPIYCTYSDDEGDTWYTPFQLVNFGAIWHFGYSYQETTDRDIIHLVVQHQTVNLASRENVFYMCSTDGGDSWKKRDGTPITLPASQSAMDWVWNTQQTRVHDITADPVTHLPYICAVYPLTADEPDIYWLGLINNTWVKEPVCKTLPFYRKGIPSCYTSGGCIDPKNPTTMYNATAVGNVTLMQEWVRVNDVWLKISDITIDPSRWAIRPHVPYDYHQYFRCAWCDGLYTDYHTGSWWTDLFIIGKPYAPPSIAGCNQVGKAWGFRRYSVPLNSWL
jgi:hypothetical protein